MNRNGSQRTDRHPRTCGDMWWLTPKATLADVQALADTARATRSRLVAHPATLEQACRTASPFGPLARSTTLTAAVLGVDVAADRAFPEGLVVAVATNGE